MLSFLLILILTTAIGVVKKKIFLVPPRHLPDELEEKTGWRAIIWGSMYTFLMLVVFFIAVQKMEPSRLEIIVSIVIAAVLSPLIYFQA